MKRTNAEHPLPPSLSYVSEVNGNIYNVTQFSTSDLLVQQVTEHNDQLETFNFLEQSFKQVEFANDEPRIKAHDSDPTKYLIRGDDGWFEMQCPIDEQYDTSTHRCISISPCHGKSSGQYPMTEVLIDKLVLNHRVPNEEEDSGLYHPTMYLRCIEGGSYVVEECPNNSLFNSTKKECEQKNLCDGVPNLSVLQDFTGLAANEYYVCNNGMAQLHTCNAGYFDRETLICTVGHICADKPAGFTYTEQGIGDNQYYECLTPNTSRLVTCIVRIEQNGQFSCGGDVACTSFVNGTGTSILTYEDDIWSFNRGNFICDNYTVIENKECDSENLLSNKIFNKRFTTSLYVPKEVLNVSRNVCEQLTSIDQLNIKNENFAIENLPNDYNIEFETSLVGRTRQALQLLDSNVLSNVVWYARDINAIGVNFLTGEPIDCLGSFLYDIFDGRRLNRCSMNASTATSLLQIRDGEYFKSKYVEIEQDHSYLSLCGKKLDERPNFVDRDIFFERISTNILQTDPCHDILTKLQIQYTTKDDKYTTMTLKYTEKNEKVQKNMEKYAVNIPEQPNTIQPLFDVFEREEIVQPLFNPFNVVEPNTQVRDLPDFPNDWVPPPQQPPLLPPAVPPRQIIDYSCFYSLPTYRLSACVAGDNSIVEAIAELRRNVRVHEDCTRAAGLSNVLNSYAYLGDNIGCRCEYIDNAIVVNRVDSPKIYQNIASQSNDGFAYNRWLYFDNNNFMACPENLYDPVAFNCRVEADKIYHIQDLQE